MSIIDYDAEYHKRREITQEMVTACYVRLLTFLLEGCHSGDMLYLETATLLMKQASPQSSEDHRSAALLRAVSDGLMAAGFSTHEGRASFGPKDFRAIRAKLQELKRLNEINANIRELTGK